MDVTIIEPPSRWKMPNWRHLWAYRELFVALGTRDVRVRYKQTLLGTLWAILQPLATMVIFTVIFGRLAGMPSEGFPYPVFVYSALLPWTLFATTASAAAASVIGNASLLTKIYFPRLLVPAATVGAPLVDFAISSTFLVILTAIYDIAWTPRLLAVPFLTAVLVCLAVGVGILLSSFTVTFRDVRFIVPFLIQIWMFATPIIYPPSLIPLGFQWLLWLNPMTGIVGGFRSAFLGRPFHLPSLAVSALIAVVFLIAGVISFQRVEQKVADVI